MMPAAPRHAKPKAPAIRLGVPVVAAATLAGVAAAFVSLQGGPAASRPTRHTIPVITAESVFTSDRVITDVHREVAARMVRGAKRAAQRRQLAKQRAAQRQA